VISSKIGHGGGGVRLNADGPRPLGRWIERSEIWIRSGIALGVVDGSDSWRRQEIYGTFKLIQNLGGYLHRACPLGDIGNAGYAGACMESNGCMDGTMTTIYKWHG